MTGTRGEVFMGWEERETRGLCAQVLTLWIIRAIKKEEKKKRRKKKKKKKRR